MAFADRIAVAVGSNGKIFASENRTTWTRQNSGTTGNLYGMARNGTNFVAVGEAVLTSPDGKIWTPQPKAIAFPMQEFLDVKNVGGHFLAVGYNGRISSSKSGYEWKDYYYPCDFNLVGVATNDSLAVIASDHGRFLVSPLKDILPVAARRPMICPAAKPPPTSRSR